MDGVPKYNKHTAVNYKDATGAKVEDKVAHYSDVFAINGKPLCFPVAGGNVTNLTVAP
jgi:hypothetical protein